MEVSLCNIENLFEFLNLKKDDVILYMGGRIDDDNLYPEKYRKYLKNQIEILKPDKIICHNHYYAKKYYEKGILNEDTKIDLLLIYYHNMIGRIPEVINPSHYEDRDEWMKKLVEINPDIVYGVYCPWGGRSKTLNISQEKFGNDYDLERVKYFHSDRKYSAKNLTDGNVSGGGNASDGFNIFSKFVQAGFNKLNLLGFTAFGCDEDSSHFTKYGPGDDRFAGRTYFDLKTSEDLCAESNILKYWNETNKINLVENYTELITSLKEKK